MDGAAQRPVDLAAPRLEPVPERTDESIQRFSSFWVVAYHCLWFVDFYATSDLATFETPPAVRGGPEEQGFASDGAVAIPTGRFSKDILLDYLGYCRDKVRREISDAADSDFRVKRPDDHPHAGKTYAQLLAVNLAHVREHGRDLMEFLERR